MKPLLDYTAQAERHIKLEEERKEKSEKLIPYLEKMFSEGWPTDWLYALSYSNQYAWIEFTISKETPTEQQIKELKKAIMKYTKTVHRHFVEYYGRFTWKGQFEEPALGLKILFEFYVDSDPHCEIKKVQKTITVFESVCDD